MTVVPYPYTRDDALWFIEENLIGRAESWAVYEGDTLIGNVGGGSEIGLFPRSGAEDTQQRSGRLSWIIFSATP